jgi:hypothetical protein
METIFYKDKIYATCQQTPDFLINIYNLQGDLLRQIRKEYIEADIPKTIRDQKMEEYLNSTPYRVHKMSGYFPEHYPPIKNIYVDNQERIFVETYEEGKIHDEEMVDLFNSDGVYTGRTSLKKSISRIFKNDRMYAAFEKESGYQILSIYKLLWQSGK